jgi:hypothetical protein
LKKIAFELRRRLVGFSTLDPTDGLAVNVETDVDARLR